MHSVKKLFFVIFFILILITIFIKILMIKSLRTPMDVKREQQMILLEQLKPTTQPNNSEKKQNSFEVASTVKQKPSETQTESSNRSDPFSKVKLVLTPTWKKFCTFDSTLVIAFVKSAVLHKEMRQRIRNMWGNVKYYPQTLLEVIFVLGSVENPTIQKDVELESDFYGDIVQMNVIDTYWNLPYKIMAALIWLEDNCQHPQWVLEVDDDVLVNPFELKIFLEAETKNDRNPLVIKGHALKHPPVGRKGKWAITKKEYPGHRYPTFVTGSAYVIDRQCIGKLIEFSKKTPFLRLDDVFWTGLVAEKANISREDISSKYQIKWKSPIVYRQSILFYVEIMAIRVDFTQWKGKWKLMVHHSNTAHKNIHNNI